MNQTEEFLQRLTLQGIQIWSEAGKLRYAGPPQQITPALLQQLKERKPALLQQVGEPTYAPVSYGQQGLWAIHQQQPANTAYTVSMAFRLTGALSPAVWRDAIQLLVNRHAALRTSFVWQDGALWQQIHGQQRVVVAEVEAHTWSMAAIDAAVQAFHAQPFDLSAGSLLRAAFFMQSAEAMILCLSVHHIVVDGWSFYQLIDELFTIAAALQRGGAAPLPLLQHSYTDYVRWQQAHLAQEEARLWAYWQAQLQGELPVLQLPTDYPRTQPPQLHGLSQPVQLSVALTDQLKRLAQQQGCTLYILLLAAYQLLLYRYSGQEDLLVGLPMAGRSRPEFAEIIGYFATPVVVRGRLAATLPFTALLRQVKTQVLGALDHQDYPFTKLVERINPRRRNGQSTLFQATFVLQKAQRAQELLQTGRKELAGLRVEPLPLPLFAGQEELSLELTERADGLTGQLQGNADRFTQQTLARMTAHFAALLAAIVAQPEQTLAQLPLLTAVEQRQVLYEWAAPPAPNRAVTPQCIHHLIEEQAARTPDAVAVVCEAVSGDKVTADHHLTLSPCHLITLTYAELNARANQLAHHLQTLGVGPEVVVGLYVERSANMIVGLLGILKAGGAYLPLDPSNPPARLAYMVQDAQAAVLVTEAALAERFGASACPLLCLDSEWSWVAQAPTTTPLSQVGPHHLAYVIYTSGSTGEPKGVMIEQQALTDHIRTVSAHYGITAADRVLQFATVSFDAAQEQIFTALCNGAPLVLRGAELWTTTTFDQQVAAHKITVADLPPVYFQQLMAGWLQARPPFLNEQLRLILVGGEKIQPALVQQWRQLALPATRLLNVYGPTEATITATIFELTNYALDPRRADLPIGKPLPGRKAYILDAQGQPVPVGVYGELHLGGAGLARGYLHRAPLTAERFMVNPFAPEDRQEKLYKTGDLVRWSAEGVIEFQSRGDQQVKIRGFRIELGEIEALLAQHPAVQAVTVQARPTASGELRLAAYWTPSPGADGATRAPVDASELRTYLQSKVPDYMMPADFVLLAALPFKTNGKLDQDALPTPTAGRQAQPGKTPRTTIEQQLATIWSAVLQKEIQNVEQDFFASGGHSILAIQLMQQVQQHFAVDLPLAILFQAPTIETLADAIARSATAHPCSPLAPIRTTGSKPPFFCVHGAGGNVLNFYALAQALPDEQPVYGLQAIGLDGVSAPHTSVEAMATAYVAAIRTVQPHGPYRLGGHSFGGEIAFAMAHQLTQAGEEVAPLVLLDSYAPGTLPSTWYGADEDELLRQVAYTIGGLSGAPITFPWADAAGLPLSAKIEWLVEVLQQSIHFGGVSDNIHDNKQLTGLVRVCLANLQMRYHPPAPLAMPAVLIRATETPMPLPIQADPTLGWRAWLTGAITTLTAPGDHYSMLRPPQVAKVAAYLQTVLT